MAPLLQESLPLRIRLWGWVIGLALSLSLPLAGLEAASDGSAVYVELQSDGGDSVERIKLYGASHALIIGIDNYRNGWPRLSNAIADAKFVAAELGKRGFDVQLLIDVSAEELRKELRRFFAIKGADPEARLFLWYAGHGYSQQGEGYLIPADAPPVDDPEFLLSALHMRDFGALVRIAQSKHVLSIFDSCFAGTIFTGRRAAPSRAVTLAASRPTRQFLTSGDADQEVTDDGTFRSLFLRALAGEPLADGNRDGYLTASELGSYLTDQVTNLSSGLQTPKSGKLLDPRFDQGNFIFLLPNAPKITDTKPAAPAESGTRAAQDREMIFWQSAESGGRAADFEAYLAKYPDGDFAGLAKNRLTQLAEAATAVQQAAIVQPKPSPAPPKASFTDCPGCPEMAVVGPGSFQMGSDAGEPGRARHEGPVHQVTLRQAFAMSKTEVTWDQWMTCVKDGGCDRTPKREPWEKGTHPVSSVNWSDAQLYTLWLSDKTGGDYRLPSEAEWEFAARAGQKTSYWWGASTGRNKANCKACGSRYDRKSTAPVASFKANAFGLFDMAGNLWEWTQDCWHRSYDGAPTDGSPWELGGSCSNRVIRGGSWADQPGNLRSAARAPYQTGSRHNFIGFRVVKSLGP